MKPSFIHLIATCMLVAATASNSGIHPLYQSANVRTQNKKEVYLDGAPRTLTSHVENYKEKLSEELGCLLFRTDNFSSFKHLHYNEYKKFFNLGASAHSTATRYYVFKSGKNFEDTHIQRTTQPIEARGKNSLVIPFDYLDVYTNATVAEYKTYPAIVEFINTAHKKCKQDSACKLFTTGIIADLTKQQVTLVDISK